MRKSFWNQAHKAMFLILFFFKKVIHLLGTIEKKNLLKYIQLSVWY